MRVIRRLHEDPPGEGAEAMTERMRRTWQWVHRRYAVRSGVHAAPDVHIGLGSVVSAPRKLVIGSHVHIGKGCTIQVDGRIGNEVLIANRVGIVGRTDHALRQVGATIRRADWVEDHPDRLSHPVLIGDDVWIGYGAIVLSGISIGRGAVVAAGAVVTQDIESYQIVAGNPARPVGMRFEPEQITVHERLLASTAHPRNSIDSIV